MDEKRPKAVIFGATGVIGSAFAHILSRSHDLRLVSPSARSIPWTLDEFVPEQIACDLDVSMDSYVVSDADLIVFSSVPNDQNKNSLQNLVSTAQTRVTRVLEAINRQGCFPKIIHISTAQVYGQGLRGCVDEDTPAAPSNSYGMMHLAAEFTVEELAHKYGLELQIVRPSNVFDEFLFPTISRDTLVPYCFVKDCIERQQINLLSSGSQLRNFVLARDLAKKSLDLSQDSRIRRVNIGAFGAMSIYEMACMTASAYKAVTGQACEINRPRDDDSPEILPLDYNSKVGGTVMVENYAAQLEQALRLMIEIRGKEYGNG